jgi:hypothetical protein
VRGRDLVGVEHAGGVGDEVVAGVPRASDLIGDRAAGVAMVVANHEPPAVGEHPAEALLPQSIEDPPPMTRRIGGRPRS